MPQEQADMQLHSDPDAILMTEFKKGNTAAFETLMRKYYRRIFNYIYRFLGSREAAEDLTQDVFIRVYKAASAYQPQAKFQTWVYTIARNISLNELRRHKRKFLSIERSRDTENGMLSAQIEDFKNEMPLKLLEGQERVVLVREAIDRLPSSQRSAVILRRYEKMSYGDIAQALGCSVQAVKSLLNRAKESLKQSLAPVIE